MAGRKYTPQQRAELDLLAAVHMEKVKAKAVLRATIEAQLADVLNDLSIRESQQANRAFAVKVTKTDIGRALGTANWETIEAVLARTAGDLTAADMDPRNKTFALETPDLIRVALDDDQMAIMSKDRFYPEGVDRTGHFERTSFGWAYRMREFEPMPVQDGYSWPVREWADAANLAELTEWAKEHAPKTATAAAPAAQTTAPAAPKQGVWGGYVDTNGNDDAYDSEEQAA